MLRHPAADCALTLALVLGPLSAAAAQAPADQVEYDAPPHISVIDGVAVLERQGAAHTATLDVPLLAGDRLRTERGRLEVLFDDGSALDLDQFTTIDMPSDTLLRVLAGRVRLTIEGGAPDEAVTYRIDTPGGTVAIRTVGEYRLAISEGTRAPRVELAVIRGWADLATDQGTVAVRTGERAVAHADAPPSLPYVYNAAAWDAFDRWSEDRRDARLGVTSSAYLPADLAPYGGAFDRYGTWEPNPTHGYVWYPVVDAGWRPYHHGQWSFVSSLGWTWIGFDAWSWPTHHYGRWGASAGRWYWIPGRRWGPAWVSWASAPGYVAWSPLGYDGRAVVSFSAFWGGRSGPGSHRHPWTVLPARHFGRPGRAVSTHAVALTTLDRETRGRFTERRPSGLAVPRTPAIVSAGARAGRAVPRAGTARSIDRPIAGRRPSAPARTVAPPTPRLGTASSGLATSAAPATARPSLGSLGSPSARTRTAAGQPSSSRTIRIVGQPRPAARGVADRPRPATTPVESAAGVERGRLGGPVRQRAPSRSAPATSAVAAPRSGIAAPAASSGGGRTRRSEPAAPARAIGGPARGAGPERRTSPPSSPGRSLDAPSSGTSRARPRSGVRAPAATPSRPTGGVRAPAASGRPSGGAAPRARAPKGAATKAGGRPRGGSR